MTSVDVFLFALRVAFNLAIALLLSGSVRVLWPELWRRNLEPLPTALVVLCGAVSAYSIVAALVNLQTLGLALPIEPFALRHVLTAPLFVELLAAGVVFYQVRLLYTNHASHSLIALAHMRLNLQRTSIASSQELTEEIASRVQQLFFKVEVSEREREESAKKIAELRALLNQSETIRFALQRDLL